MQKFQSFLTEGRDAPLYHSITINNAEYTFRDNQIGMHGNDNISLPINKSGGPTHPDGTSMTRSYRYALSWGSGDKRIVIEFDQAKLARVNKIVPLNYFGGYDPHSKMSKARDSKEAASYARLSKHWPFSAPHGFTNQMEEYVIGPIKNLRKYVTQVFVLPGVYMHIHAYADQYSALVSISDLMVIIDTVGKPYPDQAAKKKELQ